MIATSSVICGFVKDSPQYYGWLNNDITSQIAGDRRPFFRYRTTTGYVSVGLAHHA